MPSLVAVLFTINPESFILSTRLQYLAYFCVVNLNCYIRYSFIMLSCDSCDKYYDTNHKTRVHHSVMNLNYNPKLRANPIPARPAASHSPYL